MRFDNHTHSSFSFDGACDATPEAMCRAAMEKGLDGIAITDHMDINRQVEGWGILLDPDAQWKGISEAKQVFDGQFHFIRGIELGQILQYPQAAREALETYDYDFVLGSLHNLAGAPDFSKTNFTEMSVPTMHSTFEHSIDDLIGMCSFPGLCALAHITYPYRYIVYSGRGDAFNMALHYDHLRQLFQTMVEHGIALEMNTSPLRRGYDLTLPDRDLFAIYRECGGELVTVGSDAHTLADIGANMEDAYERLRAVGFRYAAYYEEKKPRLFPI